MAKNFKFRLEGLLKIRNFKEENLKVELGHILKEIDDVKGRIATLQSHIKQTYDEFSTVINNGAHGDLLKSYPRFIQSNKEDIKNQENLLYALNRKFENIKSKLAQARGEVKVVENLKNNEQKIHNKELRKKQELEIEDLLQMRRAGDLK